MTKKCGRQMYRGKKREQKSERRKKEEEENEKREVKSMEEKSLARRKILCDCGCCYLIAPHTIPSTIPSSDISYEELSAAAEQYSTMEYERLRGRKKLRWMAKHAHARTLTQQYINCFT